MEETKQKDAGTQPAVDPLMLENLDLLLNMEALEEEENWDSLENLDDEDKDKDK